MLSAELLPLEDKLTSEALKTFCQRIKTLVESDYYKELNDRLKSAHLKGTRNQKRDRRSKS